MKSFTVYTEIRIDQVTCPGVSLINKNDVFLTLILFGEKRQTRLQRCRFPLFINESFCFQTVFYYISEPSEILDKLEECIAIIELNQLDYYGFRLLAHLETDVRRFLYPRCNIYRCDPMPNRSLLLTRTINFEGISPQLEFTSKTSICENDYSSTSLRYIGDDMHRRNSYRDYQY
ncbi:hypothetical protein A3Q56_07616, partial [Intoshia linei]